MTDQSGRAVLVVAAHAGDAESAMGMRIRWYADHGAVVHVHCLSASPGDGWRTAHRALGVTGYAFSNVPEGGFTEHRGTINAELFRVFRQVRPDVVYTAFPGDHDPDHRITGDETQVVALREARDIRFYRAGPGTGFVPTYFFFGDDDLMAARRAALVALDPTGTDVGVELARVAHREHVHHRVLERLAAEGAPAFAEMFTIGRAIEVGRRKS